MASSPTPRDELDRKIIEAVLGEGFSDDMPYPSFVKKIKQAFKDAGYMTQQEMYDRLKTTLDDERALLGPDYDEALAIAKRASGIQN